MSTTTLRFDGSDPALKSHIAKQAGGFIRLTEAGCGLYGPYVDLPAGRCDARILLQRPGKGTVRIEMTSDLGRVELAARHVDLRDVPENVLSISADLPQPMSGCEVRLHTEGDAVAEIVGLEITFPTPTPPSAPAPIAHNWDERALVEDRAKVGGTRAEAEQVFNHFTSYKGPGRPGYVTNFLGGVISMEVASGLKELGLDGVVEDIPFDGSFHGGVIEWVGTLRAVLEAGAQFRMLELGAGWGPWCAIAYHAAMQRGITECHIIGVEGDAGHVRFMEENFAANGLDPRSFTIISAVVGAHDGTAMFPQAKDPAGVYGGVPSLACTVDQAHFDTFMKYAVDRVEEVVVPVVSLQTLMRDFAVVDLVHCDIQGGELDLFTAGMDLVCRKVKRVVIGTHTWQIDHALISLFASRGWILEGAEDCSYRDGMFFDGTQVWKNPALA